MTNLLPALTILAFVSLSVPIAAQTLIENADENIFVLGGPFTDGHFSDAFLVWQDHYEGNFFAGAGYQKFLYSYGSLQLGVEAGLGLRLSTPFSAEAWGGAVARLTRFDIGGFVVTPAVTFGLSVVTDTIGVETERTAEAGQSATILYYLSPEIAVSHESQPQWEAFTRLQHRSGGFGTIANIDGSNAVTLGMRYKF